ncbi:ACP S-malonyltransferase [Sphingomicrobium sp. XHP0239]|uniref:ACP S-malonyltransferase n=1 Tax=Sphingomicrobium maritimum TaxID=3133972 RepID=UPI0031CCCF97
MDAYIFPGQGSQKVGMGAELADAEPRARQTFEEVNDALGEDLFRLMREGPEDELTLTANAQPAIMAHSIAVLRVMGVDLADKAGFVAGHSLGEYSALCAARGLDLTTTAKLLRLRGNAMQDAVPVGEGGMAALLGVDVMRANEIAEAAIEGDEVCSVANDNDPGQVVVSGHRSAIDRLVGMAKDMGAKRAIPLPVSAPFHCGLMMPAQDRMAKAFGDVTIATPTVPLMQNVSASASRDPADIERRLIEQVTGRVRWRECVLAMGDAGVTRFVEVGGKVLAGMVRKTLPDAETVSLVTLEDIEAFAKDA